MAETLSLLIHGVVLKWAMDMSSWCSTLWSTGTTLTLP